jgi:hypothetical protein
VVTTAYTPYTLELSPALLDAANNYALCRFLHNKAMTATYRYGKPPITEEEQQQLRGQVSATFEEMQQKRNSYHSEFVRMASQLPPELVPLLRELSRATGDRLENWYRFKDEGHITEPPNVRNIDPWPGLREQYDLSRYSFPIWTATMRGEERDDEPVVFIARSLEGIVAQVSEQFYQQGWDEIARPDGSMKSVDELEVPERLIYDRHATASTAEGLNQLLDQGYEVTAEEECTRSRYMEPSLDLSNDEVVPNETYTLWHMTKYDRRTQEEALADWRSEMQDYINESTEQVQAVLQGSLSSRLANICLGTSTYPWTVVPTELHP